MFIKCNRYFTLYFPINKKQEIMKFVSVEGFAIVKVFQIYSIIVFKNVLQDGRV